MNLDKKKTYLYAILLFYIFCICSDDMYRLSVKTNMTYINKYHIV